MSRSDEKKRPNTMSSNLEKPLGVRFDSNIDFVANEKSAERRFEKERLKKVSVSNEESSLENLMLLLRFKGMQSLMIRTMLYLRDTRCRRVITRVSFSPSCSID